jgi:hypothetical protein
MRKVLIPLNIRNKNERIYTREELEPHVLSFGDNYGELDHPVSSDISLINVSHHISNLKFNNHNLVADITILNTNKGKILQSLIDSGIEFVFRPRSIGTIVNGYAKIEKLITFDAISISEDPWYGLKEIKKLKLQKLNEISSNEEL